MESIIKMFVYILIIFEKKHSGKHPSLYGDTILGIF